MKKRFPVLKAATFHKIQYQVNVHVATAVLHNIIRSLKGDEEWLDNSCHWVFHAYVHLIINYVFSYLSNYPCWNLYMYPIATFEYVMCPLIDLFAKIGFSLVKLGHLSLDYCRCV